MDELYSRGDALSTFRDELLGKKSIIDVFMSEYMAENKDATNEYRPTCFIKKTDCTGPNRKYY